MENGNGKVALFFLPHFFFYGKEKQGKKREKASERERERFSKHECYARLFLFVNFCNAPVRTSNDPRNMQSVTRIFLSESSEGTLSKLHSTRDRRCDITVNSNDEINHTRYICNN